MFNVSQNDLSRVLATFSLDPSSRTADIQLANELENLEESINSKKQLLQYLTDQDEAAKAELEAEKEIDKTYFESLSVETESIKSKSSILKTYIALLKSPEDFIINKMKNDNDMYNAEFWAKLKPFMDKSRELKADLDNLKEMKTKCDELRQQANSLMASPH